MTSLRALVVRGGWEGHQPVAATDLFIPHLANHGYDVRVEESPAVYADTAYMAGVDLIMHCVSMGTIQDAELAGLVAAVAAGTGLAGWHGGIVDSYRSRTEYLHLIGAQFACHPGKHPSELTGGETDVFVPHTVTMLPAAVDHPITQGIADFELVTEQYWILADTYLDVLATTTQQARAWDPWNRPVTSPAIWTRRWGQGRIFATTIGHDLDVLQHDAVRAIIERGLRWASRRPRPSLPPG